MSDVIWRKGRGALVVTRERAEAQLGFTSDVIRVTIATVHSSAFLTVEEAREMGRALLEATQPNELEDA